ncbi:DUF6146 family protein [Flavobacterium adhaerens]|uniref:DUF6146 family protein n=1 Tax=Flavobacterium adhaerens TaxID=3149043 RepID=UPI003F694927
MKNSVYSLILVITIIACSTPKTSVPDSEKTIVVSNDTLKIENEELEYEVIIIEPGFNFWLNSTAYPRGYYSQAYLENKNIFYITEWNNRVLQPQRYPSNLYEMTINYDSNINYGYEVNYLIYNYMIFFQNKYNQQLFGRVPPR